MWNRPMRRILCLHLPYLPTERARRAAWPAVEPARPLVLTRPVGAAQVVEQVCPQAAALGLRPGSTLGQAQALAPQLVALPCDPPRDAAVLDQLAYWALRFSPAVEPVAPDALLHGAAGSRATRRVGSGLSDVTGGALLLDVTGCALLFGGEEKLARQAVVGLAQQGFRARAAIADTLGAAWALATTGGGSAGLPWPTRAAEESSSVYDLAGAVLIAPPGETAAWLTPLPPRGLRIDPRISDRLDTLGVRTIGDLLMLPRASLPARFGQQLVLRLQQALGEVFEWIAPFVPEEPPAANMAFEAPVADLWALQTAAESLLADVFVQLHRRELALRQLDCVLYYARIPPRVLTVGLAWASRARAHVARLVAERLEQLDSACGLNGRLGGDYSGQPAGGRRISGLERFEPTPGVTGLMLVARATARWRPDQGDLFEPADPDDGEALGTLIDRLAGRVGHEAILRPRLIDDHQPELAYRYEKVAEVGCEPEESTRGVGEYGEEELNTEIRRHGEETERTGRKGVIGGNDAREAAKTCASSAHPPRMLRPARLLARPTPIRVIALVPDGPPTWLAYRGREYRIAHAQGPERLETAWWRGPDVRRDYFRVSAENGEQFWIFHDATSGAWYLHGYFG